MGREQSLIRDQLTPLAHNNIHTVRLSLPGFDHAIGRHLMDSHAAKANRRGDKANRQKADARYRLRN